ncbi:hypothetical protein ScPMuIL_009476 [Solemya velum]
MRWLSKIDNGAADAKDEVISMLRRCAHAVSVEDYQTALSSLQGSTEWVSNGRLRQWFSRTWIPEYKRWVWAYRFGFGLLVNTNNGLERQNKVFKYTYLEEKKNNSLSAMVKILITDYLPAMMLKYVRDNAVSSENFGRRYQTCIPNFLRSRPPIFLKHCMQKMEAALMIDHVKKVEETDSCYQVKSQSDNKKIFNVVLDNGKGMPSCECHDWNWTLMPCKHICAVLQSPDVTWDKVARPYMDSPFFTLDMEVVNIPVSGLRVEIGEDLDGDKEMKELPSPKHGPGAIKIAAIQCREKLSLIQNATYLCQNEETLKELNKQLEAASLFINSHLYLEDGLCLEVANKTKHTVSKQQVSQSTKDIRSIKTKKKKCSFEQMSLKSFRKMMNEDW